MSCPKCGSTVVNYSCPLSCPCGYVYEETGIKVVSMEEFKKKHPGVILKDDSLDKGDGLPVEGEIFG
jgi:hypothetical protein